jgi:hypothetical protein
MGNQAIRQTALALPVGNFISSKLDDENYRTVLKAKILQNQWRGTKQEIYDFWKERFPLTPILVIDNQDMTYDVLISGYEPIPTTTVSNVGVPVGLLLLITGIGTETTTYSELSNQDKINKALIENEYIFPKPVGVKVNYIYTSNPIFAYGPESDYLKGYGQGYWLSE